MKITSRKQLFKKIEAEREKREMTIYRLSKMTGTPESTWRSYINAGKHHREPTWDNLFKVAAAFDWNIEITLKK